MYIMLNYGEAQVRVILKPIQRKSSDCLRDPAPYEFIKNLWGFYYMATHSLGPGVISS